MNDTTLLILLGSALSIGFLHTILGPDHYLPFILISRARNWTHVRTILVTFVCGLGHVLSSVIIGAVGIALGTVLGNLEAVESFRGDLASYFLIIFGIAYGAWGLWKGRKAHGHSHLHGGKHLDTSNARSITFWTLFLIFVLGPCEPLIPLLMFPAVAHNWAVVLLVTLVFGITTVTTMSLVVFAGITGMKAFKFSMMEKYIHALAGGVIAISGIAIKLFGI